MSRLTNEELAELIGLKTDKTLEGSSMPNGGRMGEEVGATYELKGALQPGQQAGHPLQHR